MYIEKLDDTDNRYINTYHRNIKIKPVNIKPRLHIDFNTKINKEGPKFKVPVHVRISKYKNIFVKDYIPNKCEEVSSTKKIKNTVSWTYVVSDINDEEIAGKFHEKK